MMALRAALKAKGELPSDAVLVVRVEGWDSPLYVATDLLGYEFALGWVRDQGVGLLLPWGTFKALAEWASKVPKHLRPAAVREQLLQLQADRLPA